MLVTYFVFDPFKILYNYGDKLFVKSGTIDGFTLNRDVVATELFLQKKDKLGYNSFICGNSRATAFRSIEWKKHLSTNAVPFHFIGSGETLFAIWKKIQFIDKLGNPINNVLFVFDHELLSGDKNGTGVIGIRHPKTTGEYLYFHSTHLIEYITTDFFVQFLDYRLNKKKRPYMDKLFDNDSRGLIFDDGPNDWIHHGREVAIRSDSLGYYKKNARVFYKRDTSSRFAEQVIGKNQKRMLEEIKQILNKRKSDYKIVISPLYDQKKLHEQDLLFLNQVFGTENVFNFSGQNEITSYVGNYLESSHYKPYIGNKILKEIYQ